ncbi:DUF927 domain-containing protein [Fundicoccus culcitae]|uniref:DUF927 domain-containing protein n=1 Tax=Fundicoccus culcitae TaxID=2969821 RepID=A0ABY5P3F6_9LACT|nr:DUF927 domain-containing protein [Fundicoccus culcitae]UUX33266.1 DUF927 domain-containing protein [Fundicoccus culcitae]
MEINGHQDLQINDFTYSIENGIIRDKVICSLYAKVSKVFINHDTNEQSYEIEYRHSILHTLQKTIVAYTELLPQGLISLMRFGLDVNHNNKSTLSEALLTSMFEAEVVYIVTSYGFSQFNDQTIFITDEVLTKNALNHNIEVRHEKFTLKPQGSLHDWLMMYESFVKGHTPLELAVVLGLSSPIISHLNHSYPDLKSLLINFSGDSSIGKTTSLSLAISVAGDPNKGHRSLLRSWNGTHNANLGLLEGLHGIPIAFDELSANNHKKLDTLIYTLTEGVGRSRAKNDGSLQDVGTWSTTILSSGELDIFNRLSGNTGLKVRVFNFQDIPWTQSAEQAELIKSTISSNYGWLLPTFVETLFTEDADIEYYFENAIDELRNSLELTVTSERVLKKLAIILATANLINDTEILQVDTDAIRDLLVKQENQSHRSRDIGKEAHEKLLQYLLANQTLLSPLSRTKIGYFDEETVCIYRDELSNVLSSLGFEDSRIVIKKWIESDVIKTTERDRITTRKIIEGEKFISYRISIPDEYVRAGLHEIKPEGNHAYTLSAHPSLTQKLGNLSQSDDDFILDDNDLIL